MKRPSKIVMAAIMGAFLGCAADGAPRKDNVKNINGELTPVRAETINTYDEDIPIKNQRLRTTEYAEQASAQENDSLRDALKNDYTPVDPKNLDACAKDHKQYHSRYNDLIAGTNQEGSAFTRAMNQYNTFASAYEGSYALKQKFNQQQNGRDSQNHQESTPPDPQRSNLTSSQLVDEKSLYDYTQTSASGTSLTQSSKSKDIAPEPAVMLDETITFSELRLLTNAAVLETYEGKKATLVTSDATTAFFTLREGIPVSSALIAPALQSKNSDNNKISAEPIQLVKFSNLLRVGSITANNILDKTDSDFKHSPNSAPASPQTSKATALTQSSTASECDLAYQTSLKVQFPSGFIVNLNQCFSLELARMSRTVKSARHDCQGKKACGVNLDADVASKQSKISPNLLGDLNSPADNNASIKNKTYDKVNSKISFKPCGRFLEEIAKNLTKLLMLRTFRRMQTGEQSRAQKNTPKLNYQLNYDQHHWYKLCGPLTFTSSYQKPFGGLAFVDVEHTRIKGRRLSATAPSTPAAPTTSIVYFGTKVEIVWVAPADGGSAITGYNVLIRQSDASTFTTYSGGCTSVSTSCLVLISTLQAAPYNLANGANVYAKVVAKNAFGTSAQSPSQVGAALPTAPFAPAAPTTSIVYSGTRVEIVWVAPADGGSAITGYNVLIRQSDASTFTTYSGGCTSVSTSCLVLISTLQAAPYNLANGANVYAKVVAKNAFGTSAQSPSQVGAALPTAPFAPAAPTTSIVYFGTRVEIVWVAPADGGSAITGYNVLIRQSDASTFTTYSGGCTSVSTSCLVLISTLQAAPYNLANGANVYAKVVAKNAYGTSAQSPSQVGAALPTAPCTPAAPTTSIVYSGTRVEIVWVAPADGGSAITGYNVLIRQSDASTFTTYSGGCTSVSTSCLVPISTLQAAPYNLANGANVYAKVVAKNAFGTSAQSPSNDEVAPQIAPITPAAPITSISGTFVCIYWDSPANCGSAITGYNVMIQQSDASTFKTYTSCTGLYYSCLVPISALQAAPYNLANGANVYAKVVATNAYGTQVQSPSGNGAVLPSTSPSTPLAPTTTISGSYVEITWTAPSDIGSVITGYNVMIQQSDNLTYTTHQSCTSTTTSCQVLISDLQALPYLLLNGASVFAKVRAINAIGTSAYSNPGNGAVLTAPNILTAPATAIILGTTNIQITWVSPAPGSIPITGYQVWIRQSDDVTFSQKFSCTGTAPSCTVSISDLKASPYFLANGSSVYASIRAINAIGTSAASPEGNGAILPTLPTTPIAPITTISESNVLITWVAPADGGSEIIGYTVLIRQSDGITFQAYLACTGTTTSCQVPILVLKAAPYNLTEGASIYAAVISTNVVGSSTASKPSNGAVITPKAPSMIITPQTLNAAIGQETSLLLPPFTGASYIVLNKPQFQVQVEANLLKVKSDSFSDIGSHTIEMNALTSTQSCNFTVNVIFEKLAITQAAIVNTNSQEKSVTESIALSVHQADSLLETTLSCTQNEAEILDCYTFSGFSYQINPNKATAKSKISPQKPILTVSRVDSLGQFTLKFSEAMNIRALLNTTNDRQLQQVEDKNDTLAMQRYLLSPQHLRIEVRSENTIKNNFYWYAKSVTLTEILVQLNFQNPLYVSSYPDQLDRLVISVLPPALRYFQTIGYEQLTKKPLETFILTLPPQVIPGKTIDSVTKVAEIVEQGGQYAALTNVAVQLSVSGSMAQMWSMVNAFQIVQSFNYVSSNVPGNVVLVMSNLNSMLQLSAIPTGQITSSLFNFTETESPVGGFTEMGNDSKVFVLFLGNLFFIGVLILTILILYGFIHCFGKFSKRCLKIDLWLSPKLIFSALITYHMETYLDFSFGTLLKFEEPNLITASDYFDFVLSILAVFSLLGLPLAAIIFLCNQKQLMNDREFKQKWGSFYSDLKTFTHEQRITAIKMLFWFLFRRALSALNLVELRDQTIWMQLSFNMWLSLADACFIFHWSPYENNIRNAVEKLNGVIVLFLSQLIYMQTDLIPSVEDRYLIGWYYLGVLGAMFVVNISVMIVTAFQGQAVKLKKCLLQRKQAEAAVLKKTEMAQKRAMLEVKNNLPQGVVVDEPLQLSKRMLLELEIKAQKRKPIVDHAHVKQLEDKLAALDKKILEKRNKNYGVDLNDAKVRFTSSQKPQVTFNLQQDKSNALTNVKFKQPQSILKNRAGKLGVQKSPKLMELVEQKQKKLENQRSQQLRQELSVTEKDWQIKELQRKQHVLLSKTKQIQQQRKTNNRFSAEENKQSPQKEYSKMQLIKRRQELIEVQRCLIEIQAFDSGWIQEELAFKQRREILTKKRDGEKILDHEIYVLDLEQLKPTLQTPQPRRPVVRSKIYEAFDWSKFTQVGINDDIKHRRNVIKMLIENPNLELFGL